MENKVTKQSGKKNMVYRRPQKNMEKSFRLNFNMRLLWNSLNAFISGILGGISFAIGTIAFLSVNNKNVGSAIFTLGMLMIFAYGFGFYTFKVGYSVKSTKEQNLMLLPIWFGNLLGAFAVGGFMSLTRSGISDTLYKRATQLCSQKTSDSIGSILILSIFCGILMFIAVDNYKNAKNAAQKYITLFLTSMVFLLSGFEHFVSDAFMFSIAGEINIKSVWYLIIMTFGNTIGALIIPLAHSGVKFIQDKAKQ